MTGLWKINDIDIYETFGAVILKGSYNELLSPPTPRKRLEHEWADVSGVSVDTLTPLTYEPKRFSIRIGMYAPSPEQFWTNYNTLLAIISRPGSFSLYIADLDKTYELLYEGANVVRKLTPIAGSSKIAVELELQLFDPVASTIAGGPADIVKVDGQEVTVINNPGGVFSDDEDGFLILTLIEGAAPVTLVADGTFRAADPNIIFNEAGNNLYLTY